MESNVEIKEDVIVDAKGLFCPMPAVKTSMKLQQMNSGEILLVLTTDAASKRDLPNWAKETGNKLLKIEDEKGFSKIYIQKK